MKIFSLIVFFPGFLGAFAQGQPGNATTKGSCSPATTGNNNNFVIECGIGPEQGKKILDLLNAALRSNSDVDAKLDQLLALANKPEEPIQLSLTIGDPTNLWLQLENHSDRIAKSISYEVVLFRESDLALFSFATTDVGYLKAFSKGPSYILGLETARRLPTGDLPMKRGDVLTGQVIVDCADCIGVRYILHLVWGVSGWFCEQRAPLSAMASGNWDTPEVKKQLVAALADVAPAPYRIPIR
jgi:hypothetical protein